jgi:hypothetical protein
MTIGWKTLLVSTAFAAALTVFAMRDPAAAQDAPPTPPPLPTQPLAPPRTKLEAFRDLRGVVVVRGFGRVGAIAGRLGTSVAIETKEFTDTANGRREYGLSVTVQSGERFHSEAVSYVDYDEIDPLLRGIDSVSKIDGSVTKLAAFQADYATKGDLFVSTFSSTTSGVVEASICGGTLDGPIARIDLLQLGEFRKLVAQAKFTLDELRK